MQIVRFGFFNTLYFRVCFCISAECPSRFCVKCVAGLATTCPVKENFGHEQVGSIGQKKNDGDAHPLTIEVPVLRQTKIHNARCSQSESWPCGKTLFPNTSATRRRTPAQKLEMVALAELGSSSSQPSSKNDFPESLPDGIPENHPQRLRARRAPSTRRSTWE